MVNRSGSAANIGQGDSSTAESIKGTNKSVWFDRKLHEERGQNDPCQSVADVSCRMELWDFSETARDF